MIKVVIPSHKRARNVSTIYAVDNCSLCVPKSQEEEYKGYNKNVEIIAHPNEIVGLSPKRQWIYDYFGDVFMIDDDVKGMLRVYLGKGDKSKKLYLTSGEIYALIQDTYHICKEAGIKLFGFTGRGHPMAYSGGVPILLNGYVNGGAFGILKDANLYFPNISDFVGEDYFISGLNAYYNRYCWMDTRFSWVYYKTECNAGGVADYRTEKTREKTFNILRGYFGNAIQQKRCNQNIRKIKSKWEKQIFIPF